MLSMSKQIKGQAVLMVVLAVAVLLTAGLSVASRSVSDIAITTKDEESLRAFSAAEAGIEEVLNNPIAGITPGTPVSQQVGSNTSTNFSVTVGNFPQPGGDYIYPIDLSSGDTATIWFASHDQNNNLVCGGSNPCFTSNTLTLCWGLIRTSAPGSAISVSVYYDNTGSGDMRKVSLALDPNSTRRAQNNFSGNSIVTNTSQGACQIGGNRFAYRTNMNLVSLGITPAIINAGRLRYMSVRVLYNTVTDQVALTGLPNSFPSQGRVLQSTGTSGEAQRRVQAQALYPDIPSVFHAAIFSPPGVVK